MSGYVVTATVLGSTDWPSLNYWSTDLDTWGGYAEATRYASASVANLAARALPAPEKGASIAVERLLPTDRDGFIHRDGVRVTPCCAAMPTFHDAILCCKSCWGEVSESLLVEAQLPLNKA